jgi:NADH-quinone oxidoreductase subunit G
MEEVAGDPVLGFTQRGTHTTLTVHPGRRLDSNYSLNTADICPVGALTSNDFRFQMRVWFLKETKTIDMNCGTGTNIVVWTRENKIHRITPRQNDEVNSCWMPDSHRLNFHYIDSDARLTEPLLRSVNGAHNPITWSEAYAKIAQELQKFSATQIAVIASGRMTNEELYLAKQLTQQLGVTALSVVPRIGEADHLLVAADKNPNTTGAKLILQQADPSSQLNAVREGVRSGAISALISLGEDLISDAEFTADDLSKLSFHLHVNHSANPTASAANVVLPSSAFTEKRGSMVNLSGRLQRLNQATMPLGQAHDDWEILRDLIQVISKEKLSIPTIENVFKKLGEDVAEFSNMTLSRISDQGVVITETNYQIPLLANERASKAAGTING